MKAKQAKSIRTLGTEQKKNLLQVRVVQRMAIHQRLLEPVHSKAHG